jgi:hypothetical protein
MRSAGCVRLGWANSKDVRVQGWRGVPSSSGDPFITQKVKGSLTPRIERVHGCGLHSGSVLILPCSILFSQVPLTMSTESTGPDDPADDNGALELKSIASKAGQSHIRQSSPNHDEHDETTVLPKTDKTSL